MAVYGNLGEGAGIRYPVPEDYDNPNEGGGPIRRTPLTAARANAGNIIYRSPHAIVPDMEPGGAFEPQLWSQKMLPDGRIVPDNAMVNEPFGRFGNFGAFDKSFLNWDETTMLMTSSTAFGAILGASVAHRRWVGAGLGLLSGVFGGLVLKAVIEHGAKRFGTRMAEVARAARLEAEAAARASV
jgi:hypothetical protein